jgi:uncharacterized membrane protein
MARIVTDVHPPLYYVLVRIWADAFGSTLMSLRSFSIVASLLAIVAAYGMQYVSFRSHGLALFTAALITLSGWHIGLIQEARMYALGVLLALLTTTSLIKAVYSGKKIWWFIWALLTAAFAYTHYFAFFTILAHLLWIIGYQWQHRQPHLLPHAFLAGMVAVVLYVPWLPALASQIGQVQQSFWVPPLGGWSIPDTFFRMFFPTITILHDTPLAVIKAALPAGFMALIWITLPLNHVFHSDKKRSVVWLFILAGLMPFLCSSLLSLTGRSLYQDRFLGFAQIFLIVCVATWISMVRPVKVRNALITLALVSFTLANIAYAKELNIAAKGGMREATAALIAKRAATEPIIVGSPFIYFPAYYYLAEEYYPAQHPHLYSETTEITHFAGGPILISEDIITPTHLEQQPPPSFWMIDTTGFGGSPVLLPPHWRLQDRVSFPEVFPHQGDVVLSRYERVL